MKVGVNLISFGPGASPESLSRWAAFAENGGYHFVPGPRTGDVEAGGTNFGLVAGWSFPARK